MLPPSDRSSSAHHDHGAAVPPATHATRARRHRQAVTIARHPLSLAFLLLLANLALFACAWTLQNEPMTDDPSIDAVARVAAVDSAPGCQECAAAEL